MKKLSKIVATCMAVALSASVMTGCAPQGEAKAVSYVGLDINPEITLSLDKNDKVLSVYAGNEDAKIMLYGESLEGLKIDVAVDKIADIAVELGYVSDKNYGINFTVEGKINKQDFIEKAKAKFSEKAGSIDLNFTEDGKFSIKRQLEDLKAEYPTVQAIQELTAGKLRLVLEAIELDGSLTITAAAEMDMDDLIEIINEKAKKIEHYMDKAYDFAVKQANHVYEEAKAGILDSIYLAPYLNFIKYPVNNALLYNTYSLASRTLSHAIVIAEKNAQIAKEVSVPTQVVDGIALTLNFDATQKEEFVMAITVDGVITLDAIEDYLDGYFKNMSEDALDAIENQIDLVEDMIDQVEDQLDNGVHGAYQEQIEDVIETIEDAFDKLPESLKASANAYATELETIVNSISQAVEGKEPLAALYSAKAVIDEKAQEIKEVMYAELEENGDLDAVLAQIDAVQSGLDLHKQTLDNTIKGARDHAKNFFDQKKEELKGPKH